MNYGEMKETLRQMSILAHTYTPTFSEHRNSSKTDATSSFSVP